MRSKAGRLIFGIIVLITIIFAFAYFVGGVSATYPPIKKYVYNGSIKQLGNSLQKFVESHPNIKCKVTARDSGNLTVSFRDIEIQIKKGSKDISYDLACDETNEGNSNNTVIALTMAYDHSNNNGGYSIKANGINILLNIFDSDLLRELKRDQHVIISPKPESFFDKFHIY